MKKIAIVVVVVLMLQVTVYASQAGLVTSDVSASPNPSYGAPSVTLTADLSIDSNPILTAASSGTKAGEISDVPQEEAANTINSNLNFSGIIIEDVDSPGLVNPNASFNVTVHTRYNFSRETEVVIFLYDYDAWDQNDDYIDFRPGNLSGTGNKSFVFEGLAITRPKVVNLAAVAGYMNESGKLVLSDVFLFPTVSLNFTIDTFVLPSTVKSNEIFNVTIGASYNVAPATDIHLDIFDWDTENWTRRYSKTISGSDSQSFNLSLTAPPSADMHLVLIPWFSYEFGNENDTIRGLLGHRNFSVTVIDYWIAAAEYFIGSLGEDGTGIPMSASDGAFDSSAERVTARVPIEHMTTGSHTLYVHGMDSLGNWGNATSVILDVTCPISISDMDYPAEAKLYNPFPVTVNTDYYFGSETKTRISIYNRDTGQLLASSNEKALSGSGSEQFRLDPLTGSLGLLTLAARAEYYLDDVQKWVSRDSSDFSINVTSPIMITNLEYPETVKRYDIFTVIVNTNYSVRVRTTVRVSLYDRDTEKSIIDSTEKELAGTGSERFRLDPFARSAGAMNLSARGYYLDAKEPKWIFCDSLDFSVSVRQP